MTQVCSSEQEIVGTLTFLSGGEEFLKRENNGSRIYNLVKSDNPEGTFWIVGSGETTDIVLHDEKGVDPLVFILGYSRREQDEVGMFSLLCEWTLNGTHLNGVDVIAGSVILKHGDTLSLPMDYIHQSTPVLPHLVIQLGVGPLGSKQRLREDKLVLARRRSDYLDAKTRPNLPSITQAFLDELR